MEWTDSAFVLDVGQMREVDLRLQLLTPTRGVVSVFAFGGSRSRRRFCGCLDLLNLLRVRVRASRNGMYLSLQEAVLVGGPRRLRTDRRRLGMAVNCVRFLEALGMAPDGNRNAFNLLRDVLQLFEQAETVQEVMPPLFRLRLASDQGYVPFFTNCARCGTPSAGLEKAFFSVSNGTLLCPKCAARTSLHMEIGGESLDVLRKVQENSPLLWNLDQVSSGAQRDCARLADGFVQYHLGLTWERGRFRRN